MVELEKKQKQSLSVHDKIRKAAFVDIKNEDGKNRDSFINKRNHRINRKILGVKRRVNSIQQKFRLWVSFVDWSNVKTDILKWGVRVIIEGFTANFATHYLLGIEFNFMTMVAHGFAINQLVSIYWRLRRNGTDSKISEKNK